MQSPVNQGEVVSPVLLSQYVNKTRVSHHTELALYADDNSPHSHIPQTVTSYQLSGDLTLADFSTGY